MTNKLWISIGTAVVSAIVIHYTKKIIENVIEDIASTIEVKKDFNYEMKEIT